MPINFRKFNNYLLIRKKKINFRSENILLVLKSIDNKIPLFSYLIQAYTLKCFLGYKSVADILNELKKDKKNSFQAHAWVEENTKIVFGQDSSFKQIAKWI